MVENRLRVNGARYAPTWNSLTTYPTPNWFHEAKFGIYTHWGVYSVPAHGPNATWYPHHMYRPGSPQYDYHMRTYGGPAQFGYKDFIPMFTAEKFDADEWAELFKQAGARFAGPVGEHHDGFCMWDTQYSEWSAARMGPRRDVVGELEKAIRRQDMRFLVSLHHAELWWYYPHWIPEYDTADPRYASFYGEAHNSDGKVGPKFLDQDRPNKQFMETWKAKTLEVIDKYGPDILWFDDYGLRGIPEQYTLDMLAYYYNWAHQSGREVVVTYKENGLASGSGIVDLELGRMNRLPYHEWITDTTVDDGHGWSYLKETPPFKTVSALVHYLVDNVSKRGHVLLNIGPRPDGTIPNEVQEMLKGIGRWLAVNGEAIFDTAHWVTYGEGPTQIMTGKSFNEKDIAGFTPSDVRFTVKDNVLYATCLGWPGKQITIETLRSLYPAEILSVKMLGCEQELRWSLDDKGMTIETPAERPCDHAYVFKIVRGQPY